LFSILKLADKISEEADNEKFKFRILSQILVWTTFASQLAALKPKDASLLDEVSDYFENLLAENKGDHSKLNQSEADLVWKIMLVGWNYFCRTASKQTSVTKLVFAYHEMFMSSLAKGKSPSN